MAIFALTACDIEAPPLEPSEDTCTALEEGNVRGRDGAVCTDGLWLVAGDSDVGDLVDVSQNACGGTKQLADEPGSACGACEFGEFVCDGVNATTCEDAVGCPPNYISMLAATDIEDDKATLNAIIVAVDEDDSPIDHGFCWAIKDESGQAVDEKCKVLGALTKADEGKKIQLEIKDLLPGHRYYTQAFLILADNPNEVHRSRAQDFVSFAPAPTKLTASDDESAHVVLQWEAVEGALRYEVHRDGEHLEAFDEVLEDGATTVEDTSADLGTLVFSDLIPAPTNDSFDYVLLKAVEASSIEPEPHAYTVVAVYPNATSAPSHEAEGTRRVGEISYRWMGSRPGNDISFEELTALDDEATDYRDFNAASDGTSRNYYLEASAPGAANKSSNRITGNRKKGTGLLIKTLSADDITATSATLNGEITALGGQDITERGFCFGTTPAPGHCEALDTISQSGVFSMPAKGLESGTTYFFRAYVRAQSDLTHGNETSFVTVPSKPVISQTTRHLQNAVNISWAAVKGATTYNIYRVGLEAQDTIIKIGTVDGQTLMYADTDAAAPTFPNSPTVVVTKTPTQVKLSWETPPERLGTEYRYRITAENTSGESAQSAPKLGRRRYLVTGYKLKIGDAGYIKLGTVNDYFDRDAPSPTINPGTIAASGNIASYVKLDSVNASVSRGADVVYRMVTINAAGQSPVTLVTGNKSAASLRYQWERSATNDPTNFEVLKTTTAPTYNDATAQPGRIYLYQVKYFADGAQEKMCTNSVKGLINDK